MDPAIWSVIRDETSAHEPEIVSDAIDVFIFCKRAFANEEMVLD